MKTLVTVLLVLAVSICADAQNLNGNWKGTINGPNGDFDLTFTFKVVGDSLTGEITSQMGSIPIENGKIHGNEFSYDISFNGQTMSRNGIIDGDVVTIKGGMRPEPMVLHRVVEASKIDGTWKTKVQGPQGDMELFFTFKVEGDSLTGSDSSAMGTIPITNGKVHGTDFSFDIDMQGMKISHTCSYMASDSIDMKADIMDQVMDFKLSRVMP